MKTDPSDSVSKVTFFRNTEFGNCCFLQIYFWVKRRPKAAIKLVPSNRLWKTKKTAEHLVFSPTYALIYIIKILSQAITLVALFTPTCFDPYGSKHVGVKSATNVIVCDNILIIYIVYECISW